MVFVFCFSLCSINRTYSQCQPPPNFNNLISNTGFEQSCIGIPELIFQDPFTIGTNKCIENWKKSQGTPHLLVLPSILKANKENEKYFAGLVGHNTTSMGVNSCGRESFYQELTKTLVKDQIYILNYQVRSSGPGMQFPPPNQEETTFFSPEAQQISYNVKIGTNITPSDDFSCNYDPFFGSQTIVSETINSEPIICKELSFSPNGDRTSILFETDPKLSQQAILWIDNVKVWCESILSLSTSFTNTAWNNYSFQANTSGTGVTVNSWKWDFGDGTSSTAQNPNHTFPYPGTYTVSVTIIDSRGCTKQQTLTIASFNNECDCPPGNGNVNIGTHNSNTSISNTSIGSANTYTNTNRCLSIKGTLFVNKNFEIFGGEIRMHPCAQILVQPSYTFKCTNVNESGGIHGCTNMWKTISVWSGATLKLRNCIVSDGEHAVELRGNATTVIGGSTFSNNHTGVYCFEPFGTNLTAKLDFSGTNTINSTINGLLLQFGGQKDIPTGRGFVGIDVNNFNLLNINVDTKLNLNRLSNGIMSTNSFVILNHNLAISDMTKSLNNNITQGSGLYAFSDKNSLGYSSGIRGPFNGSGISMVNNCINGVYAEGSYIDLTRWAFDNMQRFTYFKNPRMNQLSLEACIATGIKDIGVYGEFVSSSPGNISIADNEITVGSTVATSLQPIGVRLRNANAFSVPNISIKNNGKILLQPSSNNGFICGIMNERCDNTDIINNPITITVDKGFGILSQNIMGGNITYNNIEGSGFVSANQGSSFGIVASGNNTVNYSCNVLNNTSIGFGVSGMNLLTDQIQRTKFNRHFIGLKYLNGTSHTGEQKLTDNTWIFPAPNSGLQAQHVGGQIAAQKSKYTVSTGASFLPIPVDPANWFTPKINTPQTCSGIPTPPVIGISNLDSTIASLGFAGFSDYLALQWVAERELYKKLQEYPGLMTSNNVAATFFSSRTNTSVGKVERIRQLLNIGSKPTNLEKIQIDFTSNRLRFWSDSLIKTDFSLRTAIGQDSINLLAKRLIVSDSIFSQQFVQNIIRDTIELRMKLANSGAQTILSQYVPANVWEKSEFFILQTMVYRDVDNLSLFVKDSLIRIASKCVGKYSQAVYEARAMLGDTIIWQDNCPLTSNTSQRIRTPKQQQFELSSTLGGDTSPDLKGPQQLQPISIQIYTIGGHHVKTIKVQYFDGVQPLDMNELGAGMYLIVIEGQNGTETLKFIKQ